jgi:hypothetical protein
MEGWRDFLGKARKKLKPEEEENEPSSLVKALMKRGNLTRKQAEAMAKRRVDLEESDDLLARVSSDLSNK